MTGKSDDDYWFSSEKKSFSFEDERIFNDFQTAGDTIIKDLSKKSSQQIFSGITSTQSECSVPINLIVSKRILDIFLEDGETQNALQNKLLVDETVQNIFLDKPFELKHYRSLEDKTKLLDAAIKIMDGNCILTVILFLQMTLKKCLVYELLSTRPIAYEHYARYLTVRLNTSELTDMSLLTGNSWSVGPKLFKIIIDNFLTKGTTELLLQRLKSFFNNHYKIGVADESNERILKKYIHLLEWQNDMKSYENMAMVQELSVQASLTLCCKHFWNATDGHPCSPNTLAKQQGVSERQLHWIVLDVKALSQSWNEIIKVFIKNNLFGNKKVINSSILAERIVSRLAEHNAPPNILETFLGMIDDQERSIAFAFKSKCHRYVINLFVLQRDRISLLNYMDKMHPQCEDYSFAENALRCMKTKWKN